MRGDRRGRAGRSPRRAIELHIEKLMLHGLAPGETDEVVEAIRQELSRLLAGDGVGGRLTRSGASGTVDAGSVSVAAGAGGEALGRAVARAVYGGLVR